MSYVRMDSWRCLSEPKFCNRCNIIRVPSNSTPEAPDKVAFREDVICSFVSLSTNFTSRLLKNGFGHQGCSAVDPVLRQQPGEKFDTWGREVTPEKLKGGAWLFLSRGHPVDEPGQ
jgi:hypothetical protein